ncbi:unnamed protein product [Pleuronectes platessa]|uniref:Uncharacterized protein n=1 Tax=Pleuronectes platessa TaxID=8262 RepID=A0A9N7VN28_PLEPL|nr:unnamed protein product [Pleuronectes platessa]
MPNGKAQSKELRCESGYESGRQLRGQRVGVDGGLMQRASTTQGQEGAPPHEALRSLVHRRLDDGLTLWSAKPSPTIEQCQSKYSKEIETTSPHIYIHMACNGMIAWCYQSKLRRLLRTHRNNHNR